MTSPRIPGPPRVLPRQARIGGARHNGRVRLPKFLRRRSRQNLPQVPDASLEYLAAFVTARQGVEAWIEQPNTFTRPSLLLIAYDGEWTRRSVPDVAWARQFAARHGIPAYDAGVVPYPQRMRDYNARKRPPKPSTDD